MEFHNPTKDTYHYLVVVEVRDPSDKVVYDSNVVGENIDGARSMVPHSQAR